MSAKLIPVPCKTQWQMYKAEFYAILNAMPTLKKKY